MQDNVHVKIKLNTQKNVIELSFMDFNMDTYFFSLF
jgi:hypothetical protein